MEYCCWGCKTMFMLYHARNVVMWSQETCLGHSLPKMTYHNAGEGTA